MKKVLLAGLVFGSIAMAQTYYDVLPYAGYLNYGGSTTKDKGYIGGVYFSATQSPWKTEIDAEHTNISYKSQTETDKFGRTTTTTQPDLKQTDLTLKVNYYQGDDLVYNAGLHYINTTDTLTDNAKIYMAGVLYYKTAKCNAGIDVYYSDYSNLSISPKLYQISPKVGMNFGDYNSNIGSFYAQAKIDYIKPIKNRSENDLRNSYTSLELNLNNYYGKFTTSINGWIGKRAYAVENSGFIVNNIGNEQTGGMKIAESYKLDKTQSIKFEYSYTKFKDNGNSHLNTYLVSYNYGF
jgi:hypothetical protein